MQEGKLHPTADIHIRHSAGPLGVITLQKSVQPRNVFEQPRYGKGNRKHGYFP